MRISQVLRELLQTLIRAKLAQMTPKAVVLATELSPRILRRWKNNFLLDNKHNWKKR
jgi:hypothetical protein